MWIRSKWTRGNLRASARWITRNRESVEYRYRRVLSTVGCGEVHWIWSKGDKHADTFRSHHEDGTNLGHQVAKRCGWKRCGRCGTLAGANRGEESHVSPVTTACLLVRSRSTPSYGWLDNVGFHLFFEDWVRRCAKVVGPDNELVFRVAKELRGPTPVWHDLCWSI